MKSAIKRIGLLLRYDAAIFRKKLLWGVGVLECGFLIIMVLYCWSKHFTIGTDINLATLFTITKVYFMISNYAVLFLMTGLLHQKFNHGSDSIPFVMLPASTAEKTTVIHLSYLAGFLANLILFGVNMLLLWGVLSMFHSDISEIIHLSGEQVRTKGAIFFIVSALFSYIVYLNINMLFRKNPQPKSIFLMSLLGMTYLWFIGYIFQSALNEGSFKPTEPDVYNALLVMCGVLMLPTIALFCSFYYKIKEKQIK